jgi:23S rRNA pseudouridine2605 synthase
MMSVRIQKALADAGVASRRRAEELVAAGRVQVDGVPARVGMTVDRGTQRIEVVEWLADDPYPRAVVRYLPDPEGAVGEEAMPIGDSPVPNRDSSANCPGR